jgi:hypothetical protein
MKEILTYRDTYHLFLRELLKRYAKNSSPEYLIVDHYCYQKRKNYPRFQYQYMLVSQELHQIMSEDQHDTLEDV